MQNDIGKVTYLQNNIISGKKSLIEKRKKVYSR